MAEGGVASKLEQLSFWAGASREIFTIVKRPKIKASFKRQHISARKKEGGHVE